MPTQTISVQGKGLDCCLPTSPPRCVHCFPPLFLCGYLKLLLWKHKHQKTNLQSTANPLVSAAALWRSLQSREKPSALFWALQPPPISTYVLGINFLNFLHTRKKCFISPTLPYLKTTTIFIFLNLPGTWCWKKPDKAARFQLAGVVWF